MKNFKVLIAVAFVFAFLDLASLSVLLPVSASQEG